MTILRSLAVSLALAVPASAGGVFLDLPTLTWPAPADTTQSTMQGAPTPK